MISSIAQLRTSIDSYNFEIAKVVLNEINKAFELREWIQLKQTVPKAFKKCIFSISKCVFRIS